MAGRLLSVNVGMPRDVAWQGKTVRTAVWKTPVGGPRLVRRLNVDGTIVRLDPAGRLLTADRDFEIARRDLDGDLVVGHDLQRFPEAGGNGEPCRRADVGDAAVGHHDGRVVLGRSAGAVDEARMGDGGLRRRARCKEGEKGDGLQP